MYAAGTILELKTTRSTEEKVFAYDRVQVVGQSPVVHDGGDSNWLGTNAQGVIITPLTDFASTIDEPYGRLQRLYDVESIPEVETIPAGHVEIPTVSQDELGDSPEDVFARVAAESGDEDGRAAKKAELAKSPLEDIETVDDIPSDSPFGAATEEEIAAGEASVETEPLPGDEPIQSPLDEA